MSGVPEGAGEAHLLQVFSYYGNVQEVHILRDASGLSKCSGFVKYSTQHEAEMAMTALNERYSMPGGTRMLSVRYASSHGSVDGNRRFRQNQPLPNADGDYKLFVGCLPYSSTEQDIATLFSQYGGVKEVFVMRNHDGQSKGSAFVKFGSRDEADSAISSLNGSTLLDGNRAIKVSYLSRAATPKTFSKSGYADEHGSFLGSAAAIHVRAAAVAGAASAILARYAADAGWQQQPQY